MAVPDLFEVQRIGQYGKSMQEALDSAQRSAASMEAVDGTVSANGSELGCCWDRLGRLCG